MADPITIVGGGLAGLTLAIGLRRRGVPVTVWEAGRYPRHRVCGEFISGRGLASLARMGLLDPIHALGARPANNVTFFTADAPHATRPLPEAALCISRSVLDQWLAQEFQQLGGNLRDGARWTSGFPAGVVRASGRRPEAPSQGWRWFGLKIHARGLDLRADLEMHLLPSGYVGLCRLPDDEVNICGLFRSEVPLPDLAQRRLEWLGGHAGSELHSRLLAAHPDPDSFCSIAALALEPQHATDLPECAIGDALTMIPPVTGNGMSMAFESAELALDPITRFSQGAAEWTEVRTEIASNCDRTFRSRLRWARWLQQALFYPPARLALAALVDRSDGLWRGAFRRTR